MICKQEGCDKQAEFIVHTPSGDTEQCEEHSKGVIKLFEFMGVRVICTSLVTGQANELKHGE